MEESKSKTSENKNIENNNENKKEKVLSNNILGKINKKTIIIGCLITIIILGSIFIIPNRKKDLNSNSNINNETINVKKHNVKLHIDFTENLIFSKYNVILSIDNKKETLEHGKDKDIEISLEEGNHSLIFYNSEDSSIKNETTIDVKTDMEIGYKVSCHYDRISVENLYIDLKEEINQDEVKIKNDKSEYVYKNYKDVIKKLKDQGFTNIIEKPMYDIVIGWTDEGEVDNVTINGSDTYKRGDIFKKDTEVIVSYHMKEDDDPSNKEDNDYKNNSNEANENQISDNKQSKNESNVEKYNYYTTNDNETAKKGNTGKYSYVKKGNSYDIYWVIDFDNGYVYNFSEGNGESYYEKIKIKSGNLNDGLELSYKDSNNAWARYIHFKYKNQPYKLVIIDNDYFDYEFSTTSLENVLKMMDTKTIYEP